MNRRRSTFYFIRRVRASLAALLLIGGCADDAMLPQGSLCLRPGEAPRAMLLAALRAGASRPGGTAPLPAPTSFLTPEQISVSGNDIFVADSGRAALLRVQQAGQLFGTVAALPGRVAGLHADRLSSVYLAVPARGAVIKMSPDGRTEKVFSEPLALVSPVDVAVDATGTLFVADAASARVVIFDRLGQVIGSVGERVGAANPFASVGALAMGEAGLYVLDAVAGRVVLATHDGAMRRFEFGQAIRLPVAIAADRWQRLFVLDRDSSRIFMFDSAAPDVPREIGGVPAMRQPSDLWIDEFGVLYAADAAGGVVLSLQIPAPCR